MERDRYFGGKCHAKNRLPTLPLPLSKECPFIIQAGPLLYRQGALLVGISLRCFSTASCLNRLEDPWGTIQKMEFTGSTKATERVVPQASWPARSS